MASGNAQMLEGLLESAHANERRMQQVRVLIWTRMVATVSRGGSKLAALDVAVVEVVGLEKRM